MFDSSVLDFEILNEFASVQSLVGFSARFDVKASLPYSQKEPEISDAWIVTEAARLKAVAPAALESPQTKAPRPPATGYNRAYYYVRARRMTPAELEARNKARRAAYAARKAAKSAAPRRGTP